MLRTGGVMEDSETTAHHIDLIQPKIGVDRLNIIICQAKIKEDVHILPPRCWETLKQMILEDKFKPDHVLKLKRC